MGVFTFGEFMKRAGQSMDCADSRNAPNNRGLLVLYYCAEVCLHFWSENGRGVLFSRNRRVEVFVYFPK